MPFTMDEAYEYGAPRRESIHLEDFPTVPDAWRDAELAEHVFQDHYLPVVGRIEQLFGFL